METLSIATPMPSPHPLRKRFWADIRRVVCGNVVDDQERLWDKTKVRDRKRMSSPAAIEIRQINSVWVEHFSNAYQRRVLFFLKAADFA